MRTPRWLPPVALSVVILVFGLVLARLPEYNGGGRTTMVLVSCIASVLLGGFSTLYVYIFKPRLGAPTGHVLLSLVVFTLASIIAWILPACPSDPTGARCTPTDAVANGFAMMLVALCFSVVVLLWHVTKRSVQLLFRAVRPLLPTKVKSRQHSSRTKAGTKTKGAHGSKSNNPANNPATSSQRAARSSVRKRGSRPTSDTEK